MILAWACLIYLTLSKFDDILIALVIFIAIMVTLTHCGDCAYSRLLIMPLVIATRNYYYLDFNFFPQIIWRFFGQLRATDSIFTLSTSAWMKRVRISSIPATKGPVPTAGPAWGCKAKDGPCWNLMIGVLVQEQATCNRTFQFDCISQQLHFPAESKFHESFRMNVSQCDTYLNCSQVDLVLIFLSSWWTQRTGPSCVIGAKCLESWCHGSIKVRTEP